MALEEKSGPSTPQAVMIVEDDEALSGLLVTELRKNWVSAIIDSFTDGQRAWEASQASRYDFVLLDWRVPELSSLALFNRFKQDSYYKNVPILVMSGFLQKKDFSLLGEFHNTSIIEKPFPTYFLLSKMQLLNKESFWYQQQQNKIETLVEDMHTQNKVDSSMIQSMLQQAPNPTPIAIYFGKALREKKLFKEAEEVIRSGLKYNDNVILLSELGKLFLQAGELKKAKEYLTKAFEKSPDNLERICNLGNLHLQELEIEQAQKLFDRASAIDSSDPQVSSGHVLTHNVSKWLAGAVSVPETFAGMLNAIGINLVRNGHIADGLEHYQSALRHVSDQVMQAKLAFNLGLGYLRWKKKEEALSWFQKSFAFSSEDNKAGKYIEQLTTETLASSPSSFSSFANDFNFPSEKAPDNLLDNDLSLIDFGEDDMESDTADLFKME